jgi:hypothetical protein
MDEKTIRRQGGIYLASSSVGYPNQLKAPSKRSINPGKTTA